MMQAGCTYRLVCRRVAGCRPAEVCLYCNCMYCGVQCYCAASMQWLKFFSGPVLFFRATNPYSYHCLIFHPN